MNPDSVTQKDIAERVGVSVMTVSKALRNQRKVSPATKERIRKIAEEMGYRNNPLVAATMARVAQGRRIVDRPTLAFVTCFETEDGWKRLPHIVRMRDAAMRRADDLGFRMEDFHFRTGKLSGKRLAEILVARGVPGGVVGPLSNEEWEQIGGNEFSLQLQDDRLSWSFIGQPRPGMIFDNVGIDYYSSIFHCIERLNALGYHRIGLALSERESARPQHRFLSSYLAIEYFDPHRSEHYVEPFITPAWDETTLENLFDYARRENIDALMTSNVWVANRLLEWRGRAGRPAVVSLHGDVFGANAADFGMDQRPEDLARIAVDSLSDNIKVGRTGLPPVPRITRIRADFADYRRESPHPVQA